MRILAIETSTKRGSLALLEDGELSHESLLPSEARTARSLAPTLAECLNRIRWRPDTIDLVAVTDGPGSFTGLRIAVTAAKTFAYAVGAQVIALNTLRVLVEQLPSQATCACALMDAQRQQFFAARYRRAENDDWVVIEPCRIIERDTLVDLLSPTSILTGPVLARLGVAFLPHQPRADPACRHPRASAVGHLAWNDFQRGESHDVFGLQPRYYRPSYAEEKEGKER